MHIYIYIKLHEDPGINCIFYINYVLYIINKFNNLINIINKIKI